MSKRNRGSHVSNYDRVVEAEHSVVFHAVGSKVAHILNRYAFAHYYAATGKASGRRMVGRCGVVVSQQWILFASSVEWVKEDGFRLCARCGTDEEFQVVLDEVARLKDRRAAEDRANRAEERGQRNWRETWRKVDRMILEGAYEVISSGESTLLTLETAPTLKGLFWVDGDKLERIIAAMMD